MSHCRVKMLLRQQQSSEDQVPLHDAPYAAKSLVTAPLLALDHDREPSRAQQHARLYRR
jgi:hypothetical protein